MHKSKALYLTRKVTWYTMNTSTQCGCSSHIKPSFLPVDIQHNQCPCWFFNLTRDTSFVVTNLRHRDTTVGCPRTGYLVCSKHSSGHCNVIISFWILQARHTHSKKKRNKQKQRNEKLRRAEESEEKKRKKKKRETNYCRAPPAGDVADTWK